MAKLNVRIKNKLDTYENWMSSTLILEAGEIAIASIPSGDNTGLTPPAIGVKVGDGSKTFSQLSWIQATAGDVYGWAKAANKPEYKASEITGLSEYISGEIQDTDTQYKLVKVDDYNYKLQSKTLNGAWEDVEGSSFVIPKYDDTALAGRVTATENAITAIKDGAAIDSFLDVENALAGKQATGDYALNSSVNEVSDRVAAIEGDYLKAADKTELEGKITAVQTAVDTEKGRAEGIEAGLESRLAAVEGDYLKATDKTELQGNIDTVAGAVERLTNGVSAEEIDGVNDLIQYVKDHGTEVTGMQEDISNNADAIAGVAGRMTTAEGKITAVEGAVATKAEKTYVDEQVQALQGVDTGLDNRLKAVEAKFTGEGSVEDLISDAKTEAISEATAAAAADATNKANAAESAAKAHADGLNTAMDTRVKVLEAIDHSKFEAAGAAATAEANAKAYTDNLSEFVTTVSQKASSAMTTALNAERAAGMTKSELGLLKTKVGAVTEGKTVVEMIADAQAAATYDDTALAARVTENEGAIEVLDGQVATLVGEDTDKSVRTIANEELAKQLIPEGAKEALNELQEIAAWIQSHPDDASAMNVAITALQNKLAGIGEGEGTVKKYVDDAITALNIGQYALAADLTALAGRVEALEGKMTTTEGDIEALQAADTELDGKITDLDNSLATVAKTGNVADLVQTEGAVLILDCGTSAV